VEKEVNYVSKSQFYPDRKPQKKPIRYWAIAAVVLILLIGGVFIGQRLLSGGVAGAVTYEHFSHIELVNLSVSEDSTEEFVFGGGITSLTLSGYLQGGGSAKVYLEANGSRLLVLDSTTIAEPSFPLFTEKTRGVRRIENTSLAREIGVNVSYYSGTTNDPDDDGVEDLDGVVDVWVGESGFNWAVEEENLCTIWEVESVELGESTLFCAGNEDCCRIDELGSSLPNWDDVLGVYRGIYDATETNVVSAAVRYVDYNLSLENPFVEVVESGVGEVDVTFVEQFDRFSEECRETCLMDRLGNGEVRLAFEVEDGTLVVEQIGYTFETPSDDVDLAPRLVEEIDGVVVFKNEVGRVNLSAHFEDDGPVNFSILDVDGLDMDVNGSDLLINASHGGVWFTFVTANDSSQIAVSNLFNITVRERAILNITEKIEQQPLVVLGEPVVWTKKVSLGNLTDNVTVNITGRATNISITKISRGVEFGVPDENVKVDYRGETRTLEEYQEVKEIEVIDDQIEGLQIAKREDVVDTARVRELNREILDLKDKKDLITGGVVFDSEGKGLMTRFFDWLFVSYGVDITGAVVVDRDEGDEEGGGVEGVVEEETSIVIEDEVEEVEIEYVTPGPVADEMELGGGEKEIVISSDVHYENILAFTDISDSPIEAVQLFWMLNGSEKREERVEIYDTGDDNGDGLVDRIYWIVPHLSNQTYRIIIEIVKADHLDENRTFIENIYDLVSEKDKNYSTIPINHYVRATFERPLDRLKDITIYGKSNSTSRVEIYLNNSDTLISTIENISADSSYTTLLTNLNGTSTTFDLQIKDAPLDIDLLIDPSISECSNITTPGTYTVTGHLVSQLTCININADDVTLDCDENEIAYNGAALRSFGINITHADNVVIKDCRINQTLRTDSSYAISIVNSTRVTVQDTNMRIGAFIGYGVYGEDSDGINVTSLNYTGFDNSIFFSNVNNSVVELSNLTSYDRTGVWLTDASYNLTIANNYVYINDSGQVGIRLQDAPNSSVLENNVTIGSDSVGISVLANSNFSIIHANNVSLFETVVSQGDDAIEIRSHNNNVTFNRIYGNGTYTDGIILTSGSDYNNVTDNYIEVLNSTGIWLDVDNDYNRIVNNVINTTFQRSEGIFVEDGSEFNNVSFNKINTSGFRAYGIFDDDAADNNLYFNNTIYTTGERGYPIFEDDSFYNNYTHNFMNSSGLNSFIIIQQGDHSIVDNNIIISSGNSAYGLYYFEYDYSNISNNIITTSGPFGYGVYLEFSEYNNISNNIINTTGNDGVAIRVWNSNSSFIQNNTLNTTGSDAFGYYLLNRAQNNIFVNNTMLGIGDDAIYFWTSVGSDVYALDNNISNNELSNIKEQDLDIIYAHANGTYLIDQEIGNYTINSSTVYFKNSTSGEIYFFEAINGTGGSLSSDVQIFDNSVFVNSSQEGLNVPANITLFDMGSRGFNVPTIYVNSSIVCNATTSPSCTNFTSLAADTVFFNVSSWSNYTIGDASPNTAPTINQVIINSSSDTNVTSDDLTVWVNATDSDGDTIVSYTRWFNLSVEYPDHTDIRLSGLTDNVFTLVETLKSGNTSDGENWTAMIQIDDGTVNATAFVNSSSLVVVADPIVCGDGVKDGAEQCDDGNTDNGDGCSSLCKTEGGGSSSSSSTSSEGEGEAAPTAEAVAVAIADESVVETEAVAVETLTVEEVAEIIAVEEVVTVEVFTEDVSVAETTSEASSDTGPAATEAAPATTIGQAIASVFAAPTVAPDTPTPVAATLTTEAIAEPDNQEYFAQPPDIVGLTIADIAPSEETLGDIFTGIFTDETGLEEGEVTTIPTEDGRLEVTTLSEERTREVLFVDREVVEVAHTQPEIRNVEGIETLGIIRVTLDNDGVVVNDRTGFFVENRIHIESFQEEYQTILVEAREIQDISVSEIESEGVTIITPEGTVQVVSLPEQKTRETLFRDSEIVSVTLSEPETRTINGEKIKGIIRVTIDSQGIIDSEKTGFFTENKIYIETFSEEYKTILAEARETLKIEQGSSKTLGQKLGGLFSQPEKAFGLVGDDQEGENVFACIKSTEPETSNLQLRGSNREVEIPDQFEQIVTPFRVLFDSGTTRLTLSVPQKYQEIELLTCFEDECSSSPVEVRGSLNCGKEVAKVKRTSNELPVEQFPILLKKVSGTLQGRRNTLKTGRYVITIRNNPPVAVELEAPGEAVPQPLNPSLKIISTPLDVTFSQLPSSKEISLTLPYKTFKNIDMQSIGIYYMDSEGWNYLGGKVDDRLQTVTVDIEDIALLSEGKEIQFAVVAALCSSCIESTIEKVFVPEEYTDRAILLVHGFASSSKTYQQIIDDMRLTQQPYKLYVFDYPQNKSIDRVAEDLASLIEERSNEFNELNIIGHSLGGILTQRMLLYASQGSFNFLEKVGKAFIIGAPNLGTPVAEKFEIILDTFANKDSDFAVLEIGGEILETLKRGIVTPRIDGPDYLVMAGTADVELNLLLFKVSSSSIFNEPSDGMVSVTSAQAVGVDYEPNMCGDYYEIAVTHTDLLHKEDSRLVIEGIITEDSGSDIRAGKSQYVEIFLPEVGKGDAVYTLIGKIENKNKIADPTFCACGNGFCGEGEDENNCPVDCAAIVTKDSFCGVKEPLNMLFVVLILLMLLIAGIRLLWKKHHSPKLLLVGGLLWSLIIGLQVGGLFICDSALSYTSQVLQYLTWSLFYASLLLVVLTFVCVKYRGSVKKYAYVLGGMIIVGSGLLYSILSWKLMVVVAGLSIVCCIFVWRKKEEYAVEQEERKVVVGGAKKKKVVVERDILVVAGHSYILFRARYLLFRAKIRTKKIFGLYTSIEKLEKEIDERLRNQGGSR
tara:strand:+ start:755 stop:9274 length:8520 start_codon:yes stop_codon:yes gene_type:complete